MGSDAEAAARRERAVCAGPTRLAARVHGSLLLSAFESKVSLDSRRHARPAAAALARVRSAERAGVANFRPERASWGHLGLDGPSWGWVKNAGRPRSLRPSNDFTDQKGLQLAKEGLLTLRVRCP